MGAIVPSQGGSSNLGMSSPRRLTASSVDIAEFNCGNPLIGRIKFRFKRAVESAPSMDLNLLTFCAF
jgi:hypothetical protein